MRHLKFCCLLLIAVLFSSTTALAENTLKHHRDIVWASPEGFDLTLDIAVPQTDTKAKPVLVIFHGGGWLLNTKSIMTDLADSVAKRTDMITVNVNYRLLADVNNTTTVNELVEDAMGAVLWVKHHIASYGGDPKKIAITGDSAGGHLAAMVTLAGRQLDSDGFAKKPFGFTPTYLPPGTTAEEIAEQDGLQVQATILSYAGFSLYEIAKSGYFESAQNPFWKWAKAEPRGLFGAGINAEENPDYYLAVSPDQYLVDAKTYKLPPQFVHVGELDEMTTPASARAYVQQLRKLDQPASVKVYEGKGHGYLDSGCNDYNNGCFAELSEPAVTDMLAFLNHVFDL